MKHYLTQEQRESLTLLVDSPELWAAVKRVIEHHTAHRKNRVLSYSLDDGAEALAYEKARMEGADLLASTVIADIERTAHQETKRK